MNMKHALMLMHLILVTEWPEFRMPNFRVIGKVTEKQTYF